MVLLRFMLAILPIITFTAAQSTVFCDNFVNFDLIAALNTALNLHLPGHTAINLCVCDNDVSALLTANLVTRAAVLLVGEARVTTVVTGLIDSLGHSCLVPLHGNVVCGATCDFTCAAGYTKCGNICFLGATCPGTTTTTTTMTTTTTTTTTTSTTSSTPTSTTSSTTSTQPTSSTTTSHHTTTTRVHPLNHCDRRSFWWVQRQICLPHGGPKRHPSPPHGRECPSSWYWHTGKSCCAPTGPSWPSPRCKSKWFWDTDHFWCDQERPRYPPPHRDH